MRVKMKVTVSGSRDGQPWPPIGGEIDLPDGEAKDLCAANMASPVAVEEVETAVPSEEDVETRDDTPPADTSPTDDIDALRAQAEEAGVKVDKRWGVDKLRQEIAAKQSGKADG